MQHITNFQDLIGKTIKDIPNEWSNELFIKFEDDSFCILLSHTDMDSNYHTGFELKKKLSPTDQEEAGLITWKEVQRMYNEQALQLAKDSLKEIKKQFPQLFI